MTYSVVGDLLTGNVPTPSYLSPQKFVDDAADEIDSKIGFIYETPVDVSETPGNEISRPARLLLKRISNFLATGRLLMAVDAGAETERVHAYGMSLVTEATLALAAIVDGTIVLDGAPKLPVDVDNQVTAPLFYTKDAESNVEAFYDRIANPDYFVFGAPL